MGTSRISPRITETAYSHSTKANFLTSWNLEYQCHGVESFPFNDLTQWIKAYQNMWRKRKADDTMPTKPA
eukprot:13762056-Ditylum_brightwellii.AAC.2